MVGGEPAVEEPLVSSPCPCCVQKAGCETALQAGLLGAAGLGSDSFSASCSPSHHDENTGLFLSRTGPQRPRLACSVALNRDLHACRKRWVSWVQFDIFDPGKLPEDARIPNAKILSMESLVLT